MAEWIDGPPATDRDGYFPVGVLLQVREQGLVLVGHVNELSGLCNHCSSAVGPADVERHRFVWRPSDDDDQCRVDGEAEPIGPTAPPERVEFTDEHGRDWSGWRSDEGRIDFPTEKVSADALSRAAANPYAEMFTDGDYVVRRREV